jgi:hypothetical protein
VIYELTCWYGPEFGRGFCTVDRGPQEPLEAVAAQQVAAGRCTSFDLVPRPDLPERFTMRQRLFGPLPRWATDARGKSYRPCPPVSEIVKAAFGLFVAGVGAIVLLWAVGTLVEAAGDLVSPSRRIVKNADELIDAGYKVIDSEGIEVRRTDPED